MSGHPARHRVDRVTHGDALRLEEVGELADVVLRLRHRESISGHDDDVLRVAQKDRRVFRADRADGAAIVAGGCRGPAAGGRGPERAEEDVPERTIHGLRHEPGEDRARRADEERQERRERRAEFERARVDLPRELQDRDERRGPATGAVEERNHLWHRSHLDHAGAHESGDPSHRDAGEDHRDPALHVRREEGCDDRDKHSRRGDAIAQNRGRWRRESLETQDESDGRDEVGDGDQGRDGHWGFRVGRCLNIASIRSVTTNPPTTFAVPSTTARNPRTVPIGPGMALATSIAPTMTMPWMAFAPLISGVCSVEGTLEMTSKPTKTARMNTYAATMDSVVTPAPSRRRPSSSARGRPRRPS